MSQPCPGTVVTVGSLFTGAGGLDLGLEMAGLGPVAWQVELDPNARRVLARHWPNVPRYRYVQSIPAAVRAGDIPRVSILAGGFPCQDLSQANHAGAGLDGARSGLWWWMLDCIDAIEPDAIVIENVTGLVRRGLDIVAGELRHRGYQVEATRLRASDVGAPHRRERAFVLAYSARIARRQGWDDGGQCDGEPGTRGGREVADRHRGGREVERVAQPGGERGSLGYEPVRRDREELGDTPRPAVAAQPGLGRAPHGLSGPLDRAHWPAMRGRPQHPWEAPRVIEHYRGRRERLRMLGNSVVPQCGYVVGMRVRQVLELGSA